MSSGYPYWDKLDEPHEWLSRMIDEESTYPTGIEGSWQLRKAANGNTILRLQIGDTAIQVLLSPFGTDGTSHLCRRILRAHNEQQKGGTAG